MLKMVAPLLLIVGSNCLYNICTKSMPEQLNTFGALTVTYLVAAVFSDVLFLVGVGPANVGTELKGVNWVPIVLGIVIVGLEAGYVLLYRAGWSISTGALVANILLAVALLGIGFLLFHETVTLRQVAGIAVCAAGLFLITA